MSEEIIEGLRWLVEHGDEGSGLNTIPKADLRRWADELEAAATEARRGETCETCASLHKGLEIWLAGVDSGEAFTFCDAGQRDKTRASDPACPEWVRRTKLEGEA